MSWKSAAATILFAAFLINGAGGSLLAQETNELGWGFEGEISGIWVSGNSVSRTFGIDLTATHNWSHSTFLIQGGGLRTESTVKSEFAVGSMDEFELQETSSSATTAENYFGRTSFEYHFSEKSFVIGGLDWLRNTFSGIDSRFLMGVAAGSSWIDTERIELETTYGFTYTFESEVVDDPFNASRFPGVRLSYKLTSILTPTTTLRSRFAGDWNLDNTDDLRVDWTNSVAVSIVSILALKPSLKIQWRNDPALQEVPLINAGGEDTGESVRVPLKKVDTFVTMALVLTL